MRFDEFFSALTQRIVGSTSHKKQAAVFSKMLEEKFLHHGVKKEKEISVELKEIKPRIKKMMNMFSVFKIDNSDQDTYIDPFIHVYSDSPLKEKQAKLKKLFKETCGILGIEIKVEELVEETNTKSSVFINGPANYGNDDGSASYDMQILGGFIAILGIVAVAIAFTALNVATVGGASLAITGIATTSVGLALMVNGIFNCGTAMKPSSEPEFTQLTW